MGIIITLVFFMSSAHKLWMLEFAFACRAICKIGILQPQDASAQFMRVEVLDNLIRLGFNRLFAKFQIFLLCLDLSRRLLILQLKRVLIMRGLLWLEACRSIINLWFLVKNLRNPGFNIVILLHLRVIRGLIYPLKWEFLSPLLNWKTLVVL